MWDECNECPLRLFNDKCHNLKGVGNALYGKVIVVPNVDYNAYKNKGMTFSKYVEIINEVLHPFTGGLTDYYVIPLIRCKLDDKCPLNDDIIKRCMKYTMLDIINAKAVKIMLLGDAARYYLDIHDITKHVDNLYINRDNFSIRGFAVSYSPFVKYTDDTKYKDFCNHLVKWYGATKENNYNDYNVEIIV